MGRTACTEPQCLYKGDLYLYLSACTRVHFVLEWPMVCAEVNRVLVKDVMQHQIEEKIFYIPFLYSKICEMETDMLGGRFCGI